MKKKPTKDIVEQKIDRLTKIVGRGFKSVEEKMEHRFATVAEDIADVKNDIATLETKIDGVDNKLGGVENKELDKRLKLNVRVNTVEKHLGVKAPEVA